MLDSRSYDAIELNLPQLYGKDKLPYSITKDIETFPKATLFWFQEDQGPSMKLTPTLRRHTNALVVTIDDDTAYSPDAIFKLLRA